MRGQRIVITRAHIGLVTSIIGGAALMIGVIGLIWQGGFTFYVALTLAIGIFCIAAWAIVTPEEFAGFITGRQARRSTVAIFSTILLIGVVALVYLILQRAALSLDMTVAQRFTLSPETEAVLQRVQRPIRITGFYTARSLDQREIDDEFFRLYTSDTNGLIQRTYVNPDEQPALAQRYGVTADGQDFIAYINPDGSTDLTTLAYIPRDTSGDNQERDVTQAISRLLLAGSLSVYFDTSLGERDTADTTQQGISGINAGVRESGLNTYPLNLVNLAQTNGDIPPSAATVVLVRPTTDLSDAEIAVLDRYLKKGGSLFIMADVLFNDSPFLKQNGDFNNYLWNNYGIRALDAAVVDPASSSQTALNVVSAYVFPQTDIGARLDPTKNPTMFSLARPLDVNTKTTPANVANGEVILSSDQSYGETDLKTLGETNTYHYDQGKDLPGPLPLVVWASNKQTQAKIVLIGDSDFVSNGSVSIQGNGVLFTDSMAWLSGLGQQIAFAPQMYGVGVPLMFVSSQTLDLITFLTTILLPGVVLVMGLGIWLRRSRR